MTSPGAFRCLSGSVRWSYHGQLRDNSRLCEVFYLGSVEWSFMVVIKCYSVTIMNVLH